MTEQVDICSLGVPTYHTRVDAWECDHNQHWNVRNYMRCFQQAGFVIADICSSIPNAGRAVTHHLRYHRELLLTAPVEVRSAILCDGELEGAVVHLLTSDSRLSATSLELSGLSAGALPSVRADQVKLALPRGIAGGIHDISAAGPEAVGDAKVVEHGIVQPRELDHTGSIAMDWLMGKIAVASNGLLFRLGFTPDYVRTNAVSRMGVESKVTRFRPITAGARLCSVVGVVAVGSKNIVLRHSFFHPDGTVVMVVDQSLVTVDMKTRRATELPEFLREAASKAQTGR